MADLPTALLNSGLISTRWIDRLALAHDASLYRLVPKAVARPRTLNDVRALLHHCLTHGDHLTFRAGGTSLSGQAVTDGILVDLSRHWDRIEILEGGQRVRVQPGVTGGRVNAFLAPYNRKIGPDPASLNAAMVGGIVANNASGMCCGTAQNSYHTIASIRFMLTSGESFNTEDLSVDDQLRAKHPDIHAGLSSIRDRILGSTEMMDLIRRKYLIKNTVGYSINAFLDEKEPARILGRLLVGSEGTLGFIEEVTYHTVPDPQKKCARLIIYDSLDDACETIPHWRDTGAAAVELMDDASLRSFANLPHTPDEYRVHREGATALLVEYHDIVPEGDGWIYDQQQREILWKLRKGLMPSIGAMRPAGTTMINEDIAVPPHRLAELIKDTQLAFTEFNYADAIIFGHAKDGNIHFVIYQDFDRPGEVERYAGFMDRIAEIVVDKHGGSLKAEHGTGRNMAPFVEKEWGTEAFNIMKEIKQVVDPHGILNPDVIFSHDERIHLRSIKPVPQVEDSVNACIECGFCEHVCPTRSITLTPRQRIVIRRELQINTDADVVAQVTHDEQWQSIESCAADSICASACPVDIDTGALVRGLRHASHSTIVNSLATASAGSFGIIDAAARIGSRIGNTIVPSWPASLGKPITAASHLIAEPELVYFTACPHRWFGASDSTDPIDVVIRRLATRAGVRMSQPPSTNACCGQSYASKGFNEAAARVADHTVRALKEQASSGAAIMCDVSTCGAALAERAQQVGLAILTPLQALQQMFLPRLSITHRFERAVGHPGCGVAHSQDGHAFSSILSKISETVHIPASASCCGMAGDHGIWHPELVDAALAQELHEIRGLPAADIYVSLNPICQAGLGQRSGHMWTSLWHAVDKATG